MSALRSAHDRPTDDGRAIAHRRRLERWSIACRRGSARALSIRARRVVGAPSRCGRRRAFHPRCRSTRHGRAVPLRRPYRGSPRRSPTEAASIASPSPIATREASSARSAEPTGLGLRAGERVSRPVGVLVVVPREGGAAHRSHHRRHRRGFTGWPGSALIARRVREPRRSHRDLTDGKPRHPLGPHRSPLLHRVGASERRGLRGRQRRPRPPHRPLPSPDRSRRPARPRPSRPPMLATPSRDPALTPTSGRNATLPPSRRRAPNADPGSATRRWPPVARRAKQRRVRLR